MNCLIQIFVFISAFGYFNIASSLPTRDDTLLLVHTLFRHGNRVPNGQAYTNNPINDESYYPEGYGQLTNEGKRTEYRIGTTLRQRYNRFLGPTWNINYIETRTTNINRTKMSLELVLAGLWPPTGTQRWMPGLNWQPIPYNYLTSDKELQGTSVCTNYNTLLSEVKNSEEIQELLSVYEENYAYITENSGDEFTGPDDAFSLYFEQFAQEDYGYPLKDWIKPVFPLLEKMTKDTYYLSANTTDLKKIAGGYLLKKIINDSKAKIDGLLTPETRKMFLYSAHEKNVALFLLTLGVYPDKIPSYGSHAIVELHQIRGVYGFKIYYQDWSARQPVLLTIPGCQAFCPFDDFVSLLEEVIPDDDFCTTS
jgi:prostatic aicd phosphatase